SPVVIDRLTSSNAELAIASRKPDRPPRTFLIHDLTLTDAAFDRPTKYDARLTNPKPVGMILAKGTFGPWDPDEPTQTPLTGDYEFRDADLGTIKGIGGMLESTGSFTGVLERIVAQGATQLPDFSLDTAPARPGCPREGLLARHQLVFFFLLSFVFTWGYFGLFWALQLPAALM